MTVPQKACDRIDRALLRQRLHVLQEASRVRPADVGLHAAVERGGELALGAAIGPARDDAGADHDARERDLELAGHVGAGRQAGNRRLGEVHGEPGQDRGGGGLPVDREQRRDDDDARAPARWRIASASPVCRSAEGHHEGIRRAVAACDHAVVALAQRRAVERKIAPERLAVDDRAERAVEIVHQDVAAVPDQAEMGA